VFEPVKITDQKRIHTAKEVAFLIKQRLNKMKIKGLKELSVFVPQAGIVKSDIVISVAGNNPKKVLWALHLLENKMKKMKGVYNIYDDAELGSYEFKIKLNSYAQRLGITDGYLYNVLRGFFSEADFDKTFDKNGVVEIVFKDKNKNSIEHLKQFRINIPNTNQYIELDKIANFIIYRSFKKIHKYNGIAAKSVYASLNK